MQTTTLEQLKAEVQAARQAAKAKAKTKVNTIKLEKQLAYYNSEKSVTDEALISISEEVTSTLEEKVELIKEAYESANKTSQKKINYRENREYTYGPHVSLVYNLLVNTQYAPQACREVTKSVLSLSDDLVEQTLEAFGSFPYYSVALEKVVEGRKADINKLHSLLSVLESRLELSIDLHRVTQDNYDAAYERATRRALDLEAECLTTANLVGQSGFTLD